MDKKCSKSDSLFEEANCQLKRVHPGSYNKTSRRTNCNKWYKSPHPLHYAIFIKGIQTEGAKKIHVNTASLDEKNDFKKVVQILVYMYQQ